MQLQLHPFDLRLKHRFTISRGSIDVQPTVIVELAHDGRRGFGEATTNTYYGVTQESLAAAIGSVVPIVEAWDGGDPSRLWEVLAPQLAGSPFALSAIDQAAHDLWGKLLGEPVYRLWGETLDRTPSSNYTIAIDTIPAMIDRLCEFPGWPIYKIKLGTPHDLEIVRALRAQTDAIFRVDANCGWTADETLRNAAQLAELGVEFIEQPLPREQDEQMAGRFARSSLPLVADESCQTESDVARCAGRFHGVNVKLVKCGGLTPARRMIAEARRLGLKVMIGCMTESSIGISAAAQLLPQVDYADLDGAVLLESDIARGVRIERGRACFPDTAGCGSELLRP